MRKKRAAKTKTTATNNTINTEQAILVVRIEPYYTSHNNNQVDNDINKCNKGSERQSLDGWVYAVLFGGYAFVL